MHLIELLAGGEYTGPGWLCYLGDACLIWAGISAVLQTIIITLMIWQMDQ